MTQALREHSDQGTLAEQGGAQAFHDRAMLSTAIVQQSMIEMW